MVIRTLVGQSSNLVGKRLVSSAMAPRSSVDVGNRGAVVVIWKAVDAVCFDVDSTVIVNEGIDELAEFCGVGQKVRDLTLSAMGGNVTFRKALQDRLNIIKPSQSQILSFIQKNPPSLTPRIKDLVNLLHSKNVPVYLVSGGFHEFIDPIAKILDIPLENVFANRLYFSLDGSYANFDVSQPTSESGGKGRVIQSLKDQKGFKKLVMIGDGATDLEACPPADAFIGFGGNQVRAKVQEGASWFVMDFQELIDELK